MNCAHFRGKWSLLDSLDWWVTRSHKVPFLLGLEQGYSLPPPQDIESSGKSEGGEPSLGQGTGLGSLFLGEALHPQER